MKFKTDILVKNKTLASFLYRYDGGNNIIGYYDCSRNNETCLAYSLLKPPVNDGDEIYTDGIPSISDKIFAWTFSTAESKIVILCKSQISYKLVGFKIFAKSTERICCIFKQIFRINCYKPFLRLEVVCDMLY